MGRPILTAVGFIAALSAACSSNSSAPTQATTDTGASDAAPTCPGADLATDPRNCGACGHDCLEGGCAEGRCQPFLFKDGLQFPTLFTYANDALYFVQQANRLSRLDPVSKEVRDVAPSQKFPLFVTNASGKIAWTNAGDEASTPGTFVPSTGSVRIESSGAITTVADNVDAPGGVALVGSHIYWVDAAGIHETDHDGANGRVLPSTTGAWGIAVDDANVYFTSLRLGTVKAVPRTGGTSRSLATGQKQPADIAIDNDYVYWTTFATAGAGGVFRVRKEGGTVERVVTGTRTVAMALDRDHVYAADRDDGVIRANKDGSDPLVLSTEPARAIAITPVGVVYWANSSAGTITAWVK